MNEKLKAIVELVKANKVEILRKGAIVLGAVVGLVVVAIVSKPVTVDTWNPDLETETTSEEPQTSN